MEGFRETIRLGELLLAGQVQKLVSLPSLLWFSHLKNTPAQSLVLIVFLCQESESWRR